MKDRITSLLVGITLVVMLSNVADAGVFSWLRAPRAKACQSCPSAKACSVAPVKAEAVQKESATQKSEPVKEAVQKETPADAVQKDVPKVDAVQKEDQKPVAEAVQKDEKAAQESVKAVVVTEGSPLYAICLRKANAQAARGRVFHPGGSFGGARYEGCGSGRSAAAALANCCWVGQKRCVASAVVRGRNGMYFATRLFVD